MANDGNAEIPQKTLCVEHSTQLHDLCVTVYGNGDIESREKSLVGIVNKNGGILRFLVGAVCALIGIVLLPKFVVVFSGGKVLRQIEVNTALIQEHSHDIDALKATSYGFRGIKVVTDGSQNR